jgi:hypothetical protein
MSSHAKILNSSKWRFNWEEADKALNNAVNDDGSINWGAAMSADPGVSKCPGCEKFFWAEAEHLECTNCGTKWNTETKDKIN